MSEVNIIVPEGTKIAEQEGNFEKDGVIGVSELTATEIEQVAPPPELPELVVPVVDIKEPT